MKAYIPLESQEEHLGPPRLACGHGEPAFAVSRTLPTKLYTLLHHGKRRSKFLGSSSPFNMFIIPFRVFSLISTFLASALRLVSSPWRGGFETGLRIVVDRLITSKDHASVQITIIDVDAEGKALSTGTTFALSGDVRAMGESDDSVNRLATKAGRKLSFSIPKYAQDYTFPLVLKNVWSYQK